jgi:hypothetical protein
MCSVRWYCVHHRSFHVRPCMPNRAANANFFSSDFNPVIREFHGGTRAIASEIHSAGLRIQLNGISRSHAPSWLPGIQVTSGFRPRWVCDNSEFSNFKKTQIARHVISPLHIFLASPLMELVPLLGVSQRSYLPRSPRLYVGDRVRFHYPNKMIRLPHQS